jgi:hypothetical protein
MERKCVLSENLINQSQWSVFTKDGHLPMCGFAMRFLTKIMRGFKTRGAPPAAISSFHASEMHSIESSHEITP